MINNDYNENSKDRIIRNYVLDECEVVDWKFKKFNRDSARIDLNANLNYPNLLNRLGDEFYFGFRSVVIPTLTSPANRTLPVNFPYPISEIDTLVYKLPTGYELKSKAEPVILNSEFGNFKLEVDTLDNKVVVTKRLELSSGYYPLTRYPELYKFIKKVEEFDSRQLIIKPVK
jgi:hypothetical protein